jgi:uncharacterized protein (DUF433 family)
MILSERITTNPGVRSGKPIIRGTRVTIYDVLEYLAGGMIHQEILEDFPISPKRTFWVALATLPTEKNTSGSSKPC